MPESQDPHQIVQELSNDLMSPYCPGRTISACPSSNARKLEDHILEEAKSGKTREEIEQQLVARYGEDIVGYAPRPVVLYGTAATAIAALVLVAYAGRRWVRRAGPGTARADATDTGKPSRAELDALDDALDEEQGF